MINDELATHFVAGSGRLVASDSMVQRSDARRVHGFTVPQGNEQETARRSENILSSRLNDKNVAGVLHCASTTKMSPS
jgi:hypothetical protein